MIWKRMGRQPQKEDVEISVVVSTYNRSSLLAKALASVLENQTGGLRYEVIVVDNNSTDDTPHVVESFRSRGHRNLRYVFEQRQGVSYARNAGIKTARASLVAFFDDDIRVDCDWLIRIKRAFDDHPEIDFVGGKVLPLWHAPPPPWLTREHWAPISLIDYGDSPLRVNSENPISLITSNLACRREALISVGLFAPELQRVRDRIGSMEDSELIMRLWQNNRTGLYVPEIRVTTLVPPDRLQKAYHRRWHAGHGYYYALARLEEMERSASGRLFDVPAHLYRQALADAASWFRCIVAGEGARAFAFETRLRFFVGFFSERRKGINQRRGPLREALALVRGRFSSRAARTQSESQPSAPIIEDDFS
jgi:glycosyltransferase involved in cell wall biosynthesis